MKKPRSDAKLLNLPDEQKAELVEWFTSGVPYARIRELVKKQFTVSTSLGALSHFWSSYVSEIQQLKRHQAVMMLESFQDQVKQNPDSFVDAAFTQISQMVFELAMAPNADTAALKNLLDLVLKHQAQQQDLREFALAREKFEFHAAKSALAAVKDLRNISADSSLD